MERLKLLDAFKIINQSAPAPSDARFGLLTGFTPLALESFLKAHLLHARNGAGVALATGRFGDLAGNVERAAEEPLAGAAVVVEWADLDPRLGARHAAPITRTQLADVVGTVDAALARLVPRIARLAERVPVVVALPTLPLPPLSLVRAWRADPIHALLEAAVHRFAGELGALPNVRVLDGQRLAAESPPGARHDAAAELLHGFPYKREHAERLAAGLATLLLPASLKKGLIVDLDDTLWRGILGEVGVDGVTWSLEAGSQVHAQFQLLLAMLAERGVLIAVASKNDLALVTDALRRSDLLLRADHLFPVKAHWGPKSESVAEILAAWNVGADSVVFVDDSPMELAEVAARFPDVECLRFEPSNPASVWQLIARLGQLFGKDEVRDEDLLRVESLRARVALDAERDSASDAESFLAGLQSEVTIAIGRDASDGRAFELINKTNQFNVNGRRVSEAEWAQALAGDDGVLVTVSYRDKFGPLGKIGVVLARRDGRTLRVQSWVLSCRAFARRIEDAVVQALFDALGASEIVVEWAATERNGPSAAWLSRYAELPERGDVRIDRETFAARRPALPARITVEGEAVAATP